MNSTVSTPAARTDPEDTAAATVTLAVTGVLGFLHVVLRFIALYLAFTCNGNKFGANMIVAFLFPTFYLIWYAVTRKVMKSVKCETA